MMLMLIHKGHGSVGVMARNRHIVLIKTSCWRGGQQNIHITGEKTKEERWKFSLRRFKRNTPPPQKKSTSFVVDCEAETWHDEDDVGAGGGDVANNGDDSGCGDYP